MTHSLSNSTFITNVKFVHVDLIKTLNLIKTTK